MKVKVKYISPPSTLFHILTFRIVAAPVNVAISQISCAINIITLIPYIVRILFGPLHRFAIHYSTYTITLNTLSPPHPHPYSLKRLSISW